MKIYITTPASITMSVPDGLRGKELREFIQEKLYNYSDKFGEEGEYMEFQMLYEELSDMEDDELIDEE